MKIDKEIAARHRVFRRSKMALARIVQIEQIMKIAYDSASESDNMIMSHIQHDLALVRSNLETLRDKNRQ